MDLGQVRSRMVDGQVRTGDVTDLRILAAMQELPRERFAPDHQPELAYADLDLPLGAQSGRAMLRARTLAKLLQALAIAPGERALDVGCGLGYGVAVLSHLAGVVFGLEEDSALAAAASKVLAACGIPNASVVTGPLSAGWPREAPYDVILVEGATEIVPRALLEQLNDGGRLACIEGRGLSGKATVYRSAGGAVSGRPVFDAAAPLLPGFAQPPAFVF